MWLQHYRVQTDHHAPWLDKLLMDLLLASKRIIGNPLQAQTIPDRCHIRQ
jgi:hypothetical protein